MMLSSAFVLSLAVALSPAPDTVVSVEAGVRLQVENERGSVSVRSWDRDAVRVRASASRAAELSRTGSILRIRPGGDVAAPEDMGFTITVPRWMAVRVQGQRLDVQVVGTAADVVVETMAGDVLVEGGAGRVSVATITGDVTVRQTHGRVEARTVNQSVTLESVVGDIVVETTNGGVTMRRIRSGNARTTTVNGDVTYEGTIQDEGRYAFVTHNGRISVTVPEKANATVSAVSYHGAFQSDFPVRLTGTSRDQHYMFTLGSGSARVELESFNGDITLRRPR